MPPCCSRSFSLARSTASTMGSCIMALVSESTVQESSWELSPARRAKGNEDFVFGRFCPAAPGQSDLPNERNSKRADSPFHEPPTPPFGAHHVACSLGRLPLPRADPPATSPVP